MYTSDRRSMAAPIFGHLYTTTIIIFLNELESQMTCRLLALIRHSSKLRVYWVNIYLSEVCSATMAYCGNEPAALAT